MKGQLTYWEKISNHISRIHREFSVQLNKTTDNPTEKPDKQMGKDMSRHFTKEHTWIDMKHMRRGSTPSVTGKTQIKTTLRRHSPSTRVAINSYGWRRQGFWGCHRIGTPPTPIHWLERTATLEESVRFLKGWTKNCHVETHVHTRTCA